MFLSSGKKLRAKPHAYSDTQVSPGFSLISDVSFAGGRLSFWMAAAMQRMQWIQYTGKTQTECSIQLDLNIHPISVTKRLSFPQVN